jgi:hypothetical protein
MEIVYIGYDLCTINYNDNSFRKSKKYLHILIKHTNVKVGLLLKDT